MTHKQHSSIPALSCMIDGLGRYLTEIRKIPLLDSAEEYILAKRWREHQDPKAAEKLVAAHLRLVAKIANGYRGYGLPLGDLIAEGNLGLVKALGKFDPDKGFRFSTYAMWWIRANIQEYILHSWSLVKIGTTTAQKKLFFNLRRLRNDIQAVDEESLSPDTIKTIAKELDVAETEVIEMNKRLSQPDHSLNVPVHDEGFDEWQDTLVDERVNQETHLVEQDNAQKRKALLQEAMESLNEREQLIIHERRLKDPPATLDTLSQNLNLSRERVRQIEFRAFEKLQKAIKEIAATQGLLDHTPH